jgi:hypothetical protein
LVFEYTRTVGNVLYQYVREEMFWIVTILTVFSSSCGSVYPAKNSFESNTNKIVPALSHLNEYWNLQYFYEL